ncbi:flagellar motor switch protein FliN [Rosenbergiella epipactidis]|uniref:flagellar motor switch protein FliN n=1 Tax=Rosenbergiella epipactidis TaxID=1544694 RepID=UPI000664794B|nr:flagellar motor switch protein FliN [Rosenbergiella epipactidis]KMV70059.1 flagellar motor switch protein FliN [bacteria symbiont BFo2 of Frankliniella occidentalis]KYP89000.1 flagellar motor switch protein FliN [bacteria symbiont BFo2 of Frankliniella occidentalis]KYP93741.1 flagellar motor switch protein FliN [bacteria symbiont BFo2 of Frankliniella occidentalis]
MSDTPATPENNELASNPWAEALAEQQVNDEQAEKDPLPAITAPEPIDPLQDINLIMDIPIQLTVELGRTRMTIKELLRLTQGSIVPLEGLAGEPLDILINHYLIAQGEVVVVNDKYGVRITDIITPSERMRRLSR